jgi:hypothetical protein
MSVNIVAPHQLHGFRRSRTRAERQPALGFDKETVGECIETRVVLVSRTRKAADKGGEHDTQLCSQVGVQCNTHELVISPVCSSDCCPRCVATPQLRRLASPLRQSGAGSHGPVRSLFCRTLWMGGLEAAESMCRRSPVAGMTQQVTAEHDEWSLVAACDGQLCSVRMASCGSYQLEKTRCCLLEVPAPRPRAKVQRRTWQMAWCLRCWLRPPPELGASWRGRWCP